MMIKRSWLGVCALLVSAGLGASMVTAQEAGPESEDFSDHAIVRIDVTDVELLEKLEADAITLSCRPTLGDQLVVIERTVLDALKANGVEALTIEEDAQEWVESERARREAVRAQRGVPFYSIYRRYQEISDYLDGIVAANPGVAERVSIGTSLGDQPLGLPGLDIFAIKVTAPSMPGDPVKPVVVINGCQHAREWISPTVVTFCAEQFITQYNVDPRITAILDAVEIHFIPIVNPNGYEYTHTNNRFWRKNRRSNSVGGVGVDPNRNWPTGYNNGQSTSNSGGNDLYVGTGPLSEPETSQVATYLQTLAGTTTCLDGCGSGCCAIGESTSRLKGHIDVHSFSQVILGPWSFTSAIAPPRAEELTLVQDAMSVAMSSAAGAPYPAALGDMPLLPPAGGVMPDWTFAELGALSWTIEMRPQTTGMGGFELPESQIDEANAEMLAAVIELAEHAAKRLGLETIAPIPANVQAESSFDLGVSVTEFNGFKVAPGSVVFRSRVGDTGMFGASALTFDGTNYTTSATAPACGETLEYFFEAMADDGTVVSLPAAGDVFTTLSAEVTVALDDDFENDLGWSVNPDGTDGASTGVWERVDPVGTGAQPGDDFSTDGTLCFVTQGSGGSVGDGDIDGGATTLLSPAFDVSGASGATVSYARWYSNSAGANPNADTMIIEISDDDGASWTSLETVGPAGPEAAGGWVSVSYRVEDFVGLTSSVRVRFIASDVAPGSVVEAAIDEFVLEEVGECETTTNACASDFNNDGTVDIIDFGVFGTAFGAMLGDPNYEAAADFNSDDVIDIIDFGVFGMEFNRTDCLD